jgi:hypothetical protein
MQFKSVRFQLLFIFLAFFASILIFYHLIRNRQKRISTRLTSPALFSPKEVRYLQCSAFFDQNYNFANYRHERYIYKDPTTEADLPIGCGSIKSRSYFQDFLYSEEMEYPIAYARAVYKVRIFGCLQFDLHMDLINSTFFRITGLLKWNWPEVTHLRMFIVTLWTPSLRHYFISKCNH